MAKKRKKVCLEENESEDNKTYKLDGTLKDQIEAAREFLGLKPGQKFSEAIIPDDDENEKN